MRRPSLLPIALLLFLPLMACQGPADWMAGIDPDRYNWEPLIGAKPDKPAAGYLRDCEAPSGAAPEKPDGKDAVSIVRAESSPMVEACMAEKGFRKVYSQRETMF